jgi:phi13 family phage major tail protein
MRESGTVSLKDVHYSVITYNQAGEATYGPVKKFAPAIEAQVQKAVDQQVQYADDAAVEISQAEGEITVSFTALDISNEVLAEVLGRRVDQNGVMLEGSNDLAPYVAFMFRSRKGNGHYRYVALYKGRFVTPEETYATKTGSADTQNASISGMFVKRDKDDIMKARVDSDDANYQPTVGAGWFSAPYEPSLPDNTADLGDAV